MKRLLPLLTLLLFPFLAFADGKVIPSTAFPADISIPDQRALIHFADGTERLVIETRFTGPGTNFCWVVPLPAEPVIEEATTGVFSTLGFLLQPELVHNRFAVFPAFTLLLVVCYIFLLVRSEASPVHLFAPVIVTIALAFYSGVFALLASAVIFWGFLRLRGREITLLSLLFLVLFTSILAAMLLPALGTAGSSVSASFDEVSEKSHGRIGVFEVTTVGSKNPEALFAWLIQNGFQAPADAKAVVQHYVEEDWVFAVAKLHRENPSSATTAIHPLSFTFKTTKPVYPMRLTGVGTEALRIDLYVAGDKSAAAKYFEVKQCAPIVTHPGSTHAKRTNELPLGHPLLKTWLENSRVVTKLSADLMQEQMRDDVYISWEEFVPYRQSFYSRKGAATHAADWATGVMFVGVMTVIIISARLKPTFPFEKSGISLLSLGGAVFIFAYFAVPKIDVRSTTLPGLRTIHNLARAGKLTVAAWSESKPTSLKEAQSIAANVIANEENQAENFLLGGTIREEDSPGNYVIRQTTNGFEFVLFKTDAGAESLSWAPNDPTEN